MNDFCGQFAFIAQQVRFKMVVECCNQVIGKIKVIFV